MIHQDDANTVMEQRNLLEAAIDEMGDGANQDYLLKLLAEIVTNLSGVIHRNLRP